MVHEFPVGDSGKRTWAVYKGSEWSEYIGDFPTEAEAHEAGKKAVA